MSCFWRDGDRAEDGEALGGQRREMVKDKTAQLCSRPVRQRRRRRRWEAIGLLPPLFSLPLLVNCKHLAFLSLFSTYFYITPPAVSLPLFLFYPLFFLMLSLTLFHPSHSIFSLLLLHLPSAPLPTHTLYCTTCRCYLTHKNLSIISLWYERTLFYSYGLLHYTLCY